MVTIITEQITVYIVVYFIPPEKVILKRWYFYINHPTKTSTFVCFSINQFLYKIFDKMSFIVC